MSNLSSNVRGTALSIFEKLNILSKKYTKHPLLLSILERFIIPRIKNLILFTIPEVELKQALQESYNELKPHFEQFQISTQIKEARQYNDPNIQKKIEEIFGNVLRATGEK